MRPQQRARARAAGSGEAARRERRSGGCRGHALWGTGWVGARNGLPGTHTTRLPACRARPRLRFVRLAAVCGRDHDRALRRGRLGDCVRGRRSPCRLRSGLGTGLARAWLRIADCIAAGRCIGGPVGGSRLAAARRGRSAVGAASGLAGCGGGSAGGGVGGVDDDDSSGLRCCRGIGGWRRVQPLSSGGACTAHPSVMPPASSDHTMRAQPAGCNRRHSAGLKGSCLAPAACRAEQETGDIGGDAASYSLTPLCAWSSAAGKEKREDLEKEEGRRAGRAGQRGRRRGERVALHALLLVQLQHQAAAELEVGRHALRLPAQRRRGGGGGVGAAAVAVGRLRGGRRAVRAVRLGAARRRRLCQRCAPWCQARCNGGHQRSARGGTVRGP